MGLEAGAGPSFKIESVILLFVKIGGHKTQPRFGVAPKLATETALCTASIDITIDRVKTESLLIVSKSGQAVGVVSH